MITLMVLISCSHIWKACKTKYLIWYGCITFDDMNKLCITTHVLNYILLTFIIKVKVTYMSQYNVWSLLVHPQELIISTSHWQWAVTRLFFIPAKLLHNRDIVSLHFNNFYWMGNLQQTNQALIYVNLHISQRGWVLINIFYAPVKV